MGTFKFYNFHELAYNHNTDPDVLDQIVDQLYVVCNSYIRMSTLERLIDDDYYLIHYAKIYNKNFPQYLRDYDAAQKYVKLNVCANP